MNYGNAITAVKQVVSVVHLYYTLAGIPVIVLLSVCVSFGPDELKSR